MAHCEGNPPDTDGFRSQRASDANIWYFFVISLIKMMDKQSRPWDGHFTPL